MPRSLPALGDHPGNTAPHWLRQASIITCCLDGLDDGSLSFTWFIKPQLFAWGWSIAPLPVAGALGLYKGKARVHKMFRQLEPFSVSHTLGGCYTLIHKQKNPNRPTSKRTKPIHTYRSGAEKEKLILTVQSQRLWQLYLKTMVTWITQKELRGSWYSL